MNYFGKIASNVGVLLYRQKDALLWQQITLQIDFEAPRKNVNKTSDISEQKVRTKT